MAIPASTRKRSASPPPCDPESQKAQAKDPHDLHPDDEHLRQITNLQSRVQELEVEIERAKQAREETEILNQVSLMLAGEQDLGKLVQHATDAATRLTMAKFGAFFYNVTNEQGEAFRLFALSGAPREAFEKFGQPRNTSVFGRTFRGESAVRMDDVLADPRYGKNPPYHGMPPGHPPVRSYLAVPVKSRTGEVFGGLFFGHPKPGIFTARAETIATVIAAQSAIAIENTRHLEEANRERAASEQSRRIYDTVLSNTPDLAFMFDLNHRFIYANSALLAVWGRTWEEAAGKNCLELGYPDWQAAMHDRKIDEVVATRKPIRGEVPFQDTNGLRVYDYFFTPVLDREGGVEAIAGTARDITEICRAREDLIRQAQLLDLSNDAIFARDSSGHILYWNRGAERLYGWSREEALGQEAHTLLCTEFPVPFKEIIACLRRDGHWAGEFVQRRRTGERITVWVRKALSRDEGQGHVLESCTDITERKRAEELLTLHRQRSEMVNEVAQVGYWLCDLPFSKLNWDNRVKEHFWLPPDAEVTIDTFFERLHPDDREPTRTAIEAAVANLSPYNVEFRTISPDGERTKWIRAIGRTFCDETGQPKRFDGVTMDISREKHSEEALVRSEKLAATGRLASTIAHEINNPLECLVNLLYLVRQDRGVSAESRQYLLTASDQLDRAAHVAKQTLGFYRDTGEARWLDTSEVVEDLLRLYQHKLRGREVKIEKVPDAKRIYASAGDFSQFFSNLLVNAADATSPRTGRIRIRIRPACDWSSPRRSGVRISVADNGSGIAPADMAKIFEPFFTTKQDVGTGLGLWLVRSTLQKYQGSIRVRSRTSPGASGTVFHIFWPDGEQSDAPAPLESKSSLN